MLVFVLVTCSEGDTRDMYEFVLSEELGLTNLVLEKEHDDFLREGREVQVRAIATLDSGQMIDISNDVRWSSGDSSVLKSMGGGKFKAQAVPFTTSVQVIADFAAFHVTVDVTVSVAALIGLELGPAKSGVLGQCQIDSSITSQSQCSALPLCVLGSYAGELEKRDETAYVEFTGSQASVFSNTYLINSEIDLEAGAIAETVYASLDAIDSPLMDILHEQDLVNFDIESTEDVVVMGVSIDFSVQGFPDEVLPFVDWTYVDFNLGEPVASGVMTGSVFTADVEDEFISNFNNYGVDVIAECSGKLSSSKSILISSDVNSLKITDDGSELEVLIGAGAGPLLTLEAYDENDEAMILVDGEISWFVCDLSSPICGIDDLQDEDSASLNLVPGNSEIARDIRIEAVYHGRKAVREDYSFITN